jgi:hypothetical protein
MKLTDEELLNSYFLGQSSDEEIAELEKRMLADSGLRKLYLDEAIFETHLNRIGLREEKVVTEPQTATKTKRSQLALFCMGVAAAIVVLFAIINPLGSATENVGEILSSELAGWQSDQPTIEGAEFGPGTFILQKGIATLGFDSGAEMVLEGPAHLEVISEMKIFFHYGNASFHVPESAVGFQVDTSYGNIVDHGTRFSLSLSQNHKDARLAVGEGEVAIHHPNGLVKHLYTDETVRINKKKVYRDEDQTAEGGVAAREPLITLGTKGKETSVIQNNERKQRLSADLLMVKNSSIDQTVNRRALFAFDLSGIDLKQITNARLILNAVPTGLGMVTDMPKVSEFTVLGLPDDEREQWPNTGLMWENAPKVEDSKRLGSFPLLRAKKREVVTIDSSELLAFLKKDKSGEVSFMIDCETPGASLVHGFASSKHREAAGPSLELVLKQ